MKLIFGLDLSKAVEEARPQHTFSPSYIRNENDFPLSDDIVKGYSHSCTTDSN